MKNTFVLKQCVGNKCNEFKISGNNILLPVLFGVALGIFFANSIK